MKGIRFFDFDFNRLAEFPRFISLNFDKHYCGFGNVEIHFAVNENDVIELLENNHFLFFESENNFAVVTGWKIDEDVAVYARTPEWLLTKRGVVPFEYKNTPITEIVSHVLCAAEDMIAVEQSDINDVDIDFSTDSAATVYDVLCDILKERGLGFEVTVNLKEKKFVFRMFAGCERQLVFSKNNRTAFDFVYTSDMQEMATESGWYERRFEDKGDWNPSRNYPTLQNGKIANYYTFYRISNSYSSRFDLQCVEGEYLFCDNREGIWRTTKEKPSTGFVYMENNDAVGLKKWDAVLNGIKVGVQGEDEIKNKVRQQEITMEVKAVEFGKDYGLGDVVCVHSEFGNVKKSVQKRVTSVSLYWDTDKSGVIPVLSSLEG